MLTFLSGSEKSGMNIADTLIPGKFESLGQQIYRLKEDAA